MRPVGSSMISGRGCAQFRADCLGLLTKARASLIAVVISLAPVLGIAQTQRTEVESAVTCRHRAWFFTEDRLLRVWAWTAEGHNTNTLENYIETLRAERIVEPIMIPTRDGRRLVGWRFGHSGASSNVAVMVGFGNVATADIMVARLESVARHLPYDFFLLDYRGYGRSVPGFPSFQAFVQDQVDIGVALRAKGYEKVLGYGKSLGGVVMVNSVHKGLKLDRLVIDSIPTDLRNFDCDKDMYPINVMSASCPNVIALTSDHDQEVLPSEQAELLNGIASPACGGHVVHLHIAIHAFNDKPGTPGDLERLDALERALKLE